MLTLIAPVTSLIGNQHLVSVFFLVILSIPGKARNNLSPVGLLRKPNIVLCLRQLLKLFGSVGFQQICEFPFNSTTFLYCDNKIAIQIVYNSIFHQRTKHVEIDCHFVRQNLQFGTIDLPNVIVPQRKILNLMDTPHVVSYKCICVSPECSTQIR